MSQVWHSPSAWLHLFGALLPSHSPSGSAGKLQPFQPGLFLLDKAQPCAVLKETVVPRSLCCSIVLPPAFFGLPQLLLLFLAEMFVSGKP